MNWRAWENIPTAASGVSNNFRLLKICMKVRMQLRGSQQSPNSARRPGRVWGASWCIYITKRQFMSSHAKAQQALEKGREFFHFAAMEGDGVTEQIRKFTKLAEEGAMICLDLRTKSFWKSALPTNANDVQAFATAITDGTAEKHTLQM